MRQSVPWVLLALLIVAVASFAALGQVQSAPGVTPAAWVDNVIAATTATGSAHLRFTSATTSSDASLNQAIAGSGAVDFVNGNFSVTVLFHQIGSVRQVGNLFGEHMIAIGQTVYELPVLPFTAAAPLLRWSRSRVPRNVHAAFGLSAATGAEDALAAFASLAPVGAVRELGPGQVDGQATTRYLVTAQPLYLCGKDGRTRTFQLVPPTTVWIDGAGRLLQARVSDHTAGGTVRAPSGSGTPIRFPPSTTVSTMTFSDLGAPVHIVAPTVGSNGSQSFSIATIEGKARATPCTG